MYMQYGNSGTAAINEQLIDHQQPTDQNSQDNFYWRGGIWQSQPAMENLDRISTQAQCAYTK